MYQSIGRESLAAGDVEFSAGKVSDLASGLLHDEHACRRIPGIEIEFPEAVETARRDVAQIQRRRSCASDTVAAQRELVIEINVWILVALLAREAGRDQAFRQRWSCRDVERRDLERAGVQTRTAAEFGAEHFVARRIINHSGDPLALALNRQRYAKYGIAMCEISGAVERIDVPLIVAAGFDARSLFAHDIMSRKLGANSFENQRFGLPISDRNQIHVALVFNLDVLAEVDHQQSAGFASHRLHGRD